jgi:integrase
MVSKKKSDLNRGNSRKRQLGMACHPEAQTDMNIHIPNRQSGRKTLVFTPPAGTPTLQDVINQLLSDQTLSPNRQRDLVSSLRRVASTLALPPAQVPTDLQWLRSKLAGQPGARLARTAKTRANILSNAVAALTSVGAAARRPAIARSPAWQKLWELLDPSAKIALGSFARFCSYHQIDPDNVTDSVVATFHDAMIQSSLRKKPEEALRELIVRWNAACALNPASRMRQLLVPKRRLIISVAAETLPPSFRRDMERYLARLRDGDILADDAVPQLAEATVRSREVQIRRFFGELVADGVRPDDLPDLKALVHPDVASRGLKAIFNRTGKASGMLHNMAYALLIIAKHHTKASDDDLKRLRLFCQKLKPKRGGMTEKNRTRLRQFDDPKALNRLLLLPDALVRDAKSNALSPSRRAALVEIALAIELLSMTTLRIKNIARLNLEEHVHWSRSSKLGVCHLVIDGRDVKNGEDREFELSGQTLNLLKLYIDRYRPNLVPASCPWLFARRDGTGPVDPVVLARRVAKAIAKRTGLMINVHLFRALGAKIYLDQNPGGYEVVRRALGHKHLSTTTAAYTGMESLSAAKQFDLTVNRRRAQARGQDKSGSRSAE